MSIILPKLRRWIVRIFGLLLLLLLIATALVYGLSEHALRQRYQFPAESILVPTDAASIARGRHLVEDQYVCADCHGDNYGGKLFFDGGPMVARLQTPNLTRGPGGVGARYADADWVRTLRHGVAPDGRPLLIMPSHHYSQVTASDLGAAIAYLKTLPPVASGERIWAIGPIGRLLLLQNPAEILPVTVIAHDTSAPSLLPTSLAERGRHLVNTAGCTGCHKPDLRGGGGPPPGAANLTPVGIGQWEKSDFVRALRDRRTPDGRALAPAMPSAYARLTDEELDAIWAYLQTVPPTGERSPRQQPSATPHAN
jgi:mono/diheme cytochrome c family protein